VKSAKADEKTFARVPRKTLNDAGANAEEEEDDE
jgi:hypothetical protein